MKTLWLKETGEPKAFEPVDAREILAKSDQYTDVNPDPSDSMPAVPVASVENEFRREPVGADTPEKPREQPIVRNAVEGSSHVAPPPPPPAAAKPVLHAPHKPKH